MITLTEEQAQQIEEAFAEAEYLSNSLPVDADKVEAALATIRAARAQELNLNCKSVQSRLATSWGYVKAEQAEQEPMFFVLTQDHTWLSISEGQYEKVAPEGRMKVYAAPVRKKDLTDEDICDKWKSITGYSISGGKKAKSQLVYLIPDEIIELARAVIAADREKNK